MMNQDCINAYQQAEQLLHGTITETQRREVVLMYQVFKGKKKVPDLPPDMQGRFSALWLMIIAAHQINSRHLKRLVKAWQEEFLDML